MKKLFLFLTFIILCIFTLQAQDYKTSVGLRLGYPVSASVKHFVTDSHAIEAYVGTRGYSYHRWTNISAAYQIHKPLNIDGLHGLNWYYGFGGSAYFWSWNERYYGTRDRQTSFGVQGYIGLDYTFENIPINITLDWVPSVFLGGYGSGFGGGFGAITVRYTLK